MTTYLSNRDGNGLTNEEGHYRFQTKVWSGNVLNGILVSANSTPNMTVVVTSGDIKIDYSNYAYTAWNDSNASITISTADTSNPRVDRIIAYIDRSMTWSGQTNNPGGLKFIAVAGTPAAAPTKASDSVVNTAVSNNPWCEIATVNVAANVTQITGVNITDTRKKITLSSDLVNAIYPIGSIYISVNSTNPSTLFGGTWVSFGAGRVIVGIDSSQTEFNTVEKTGGAKTHTLTVDEMPSHNHYISNIAVGSSRNYTQFGTDSGLVGGKFTDNTGGGQAHNNLQPYITTYMWKRTE